MAAVDPSAQCEQPARRPFLRILLRSLATAVSVVGVALLLRLLYWLVTGTLGAEELPSHEPGSARTMLALALSLPVPLHVISIGLILQRRWLRPGWARLARIGIISSGMWLGVALAIRAWMVAL